MLNTYLLSDVYSLNAHYWASIRELYSFIIIYYVNLVEIAFLLKYSEAT